MRKSTYYFTFNSFIVVNNSAGLTLEEVCRNVDEAYVPPAVDDESLEFSETVINVIGKMGEVVYTYLKDTVEPELDDFVRVQVINQFTPVALKLSDYDELMEWFEDSIFADSSIDAKVGYLDDEILYVYDSEREEIVG